MLFRTLAELEYLEVDQYVWGILRDATTSTSTEVVLEVSPDQIMASVAADQCQQQQSGSHFCQLLKSLLIIQYYTTIILRHFIFDSMASWCSG